MRVEFQDNRPQREGKSANPVSLEMPDDIGEKFQAHLQRVQDAATERGRKVRLAEIEATL